MRNFNYEEAKQGHPICTKNGKEAVLHHSICNNFIITVSVIIDGSKYLFHYYKDGTSTTIKSGEMNLYMKD